MVWGAKRTPIKKSKKKTSRKNTTKKKTRPEQKSLVVGKSTVRITVDTREQDPKIYIALKEMKIPYTKKALYAGDFESAKCIAERKTVLDLIGSIQGGKKKGKRVPGRFFPQMDKLSNYAEQNDKIPFLFISGSLDNAEAWYNSRGLELNRKVVMGALASAAVRYGVHIFAWFATDKEMLYCMHSVFLKVKEGKYMLPHRIRLIKAKNRKLALWSTILRTRPKIVDPLIKRYVTLEKFLKVLKTKPRQLEYIQGVGPGTVKKWKLLLE